MNNNVSNEKKNVKVNDNKKIMMLVGCIILAIIVIVVLLKAVVLVDKKEEANIKDIISNSETKIVYVGNSDSKKCKDCSKIKKYLDDKKINYVSYDVSKYSKKDFNEMLRTIEINPDDFGYPAVIYINEGRLYSNAINLTDTKVVEDFIKTYDLTKIK